MFTPQDESTFPFDARHLNAYGDVFAILPVNRRSEANPQFVDTHVVLGSDPFPGGVRFLQGIATWSPDIDALDGARYVQLRITFASNIDTGLFPELNAIAIPYSDR